MSETKFPNVKKPELNKEEVGGYVQKSQEKVQTFLTDAKEPTATRLDELAEKLRPKVESLPFGDKLSSLPSAEVLVAKPFDLAQKLLDANRRWSDKFFAAGTMDPEDEATSV